MHASCGSPLHLLGVFGLGAFAIFGGGEDFSAFTTVGGAGVSTTVVGGGAIEPTGTCSGGSVAQALTISAARATSEKCNFMANPPDQNAVKGWKTQLVSTLIMAVL